MYLHSRERVSMMANMTLVQRNLLIGLGVVVLGAAAVYYSATRPVSPTNVITDPNASTTIRVLPNGTIVAPEGVSVEEVKDSLPPAPNYRKSIAYDTQESAEVRAALEAQRGRYVAVLNKNPLDFNAWMNLAITYKAGGDFTATEAIWIYVTKVWPDSPIAYRNLADLYTNFLKDPAKAKVYSDQAAKFQ